MNEYFCATCMQTKHASKFMVWINDKSKSRRCDSCSDDPDLVERVKDRTDERKAKAKTTPILNKLSKTEMAKNACIVRDKLADIKQQRIDDEFIGL